MPRIRKHMGSAGRRPTQASQPAGWLERLHDGTPIRVRAIRKQDAGLELEFLNRLSPERRGSRFIGLVRDPDPDVARDLTDLDPARSAGFIAVVTNDGRDQQIGAAHFRVNAKGDACDCSLAVIEIWQNRGVGSLLMRQLIEAARKRGIRRMRAFAPAHLSDSPDHLAERLGFKRRLDSRDPASVTYELRLG
ncbi:MAG TPA: GNAT family N-acetyltransferase [Rhodanobacteraceae bacterium]|nr:GNAT family N-acetyltransferase [Rhodanobacteraceae bacterium]